MATIAKLFRNGCCCFRTLKSATVAAGMFTLVTSMMQSLVTLAIFTGIAEMFIASGTDTSKIFSEPKPIDATDQSVTAANPAKQPTVGILYLVLAVADLLIVFLSLIMLFGVEAVKQKRGYFYPWIVLFPFYIIYESAINIYYFYLAFQARKTPEKQLNNNKFIYGMLFTTNSELFGFIVVPLIYWILKEIIILVFWLVVILYTKEIGKKPPADGTPTKEADLPAQQLDYPMLQPSMGPYFPPTGPYLPPPAAPVDDPYGFSGRIPQTPFYRPVIRRPMVNAGYDPGSYDRLPTANPYGVRGGAYNPAPAPGLGNYFSFNPK